MERLHKVSAAVVFAFLCLHFGNHFIGLEGRDAHAQFMDAARLIYRHPIIEMAVLLAFALQMISGIALARAIWRKKKDFIHQLQAASGMMLFAFLLIRLAAIAYGRLVLNLDTNFDCVAVQACFDARLDVLFLRLLRRRHLLLALFVHSGCIAYDIFKKTNKPLGYVLPGGDHRGRRLCDSGCSG